MPEMIRGLDHIAITAQDMEATVAFYRDVLEAQVFMLDEWRAGEFPVVSLIIGQSAMNVHDAASPASPHARIPTPGSEDFCYRWDGSIDDAIAHLEARGVEVELGPITRMSADMQGALSVYFRDPDGNLLELLTTDI